MFQKLRFLCWNDQVALTSQRFVVPGNSDPYRVTHNSWLVVSREGNEANIITMGYMWWGPSWAPHCLLGTPTQRRWRSLTQQESMPMMLPLPWGGWSHMTWKNSGTGGGWPRWAPCGYPWSISMKDSMSLFFHMFRSESIMLIEFVWGICGVGSICIWGNMI